MRVAITGATGLVGYPIAQHLLHQGYQVTTVGRSGLAGNPHIPWDLGGPPPNLNGQDHLVHAALSHVADKYRGGEGDDPEGFIARNLNGTLALWDAAQRAGVHVVFLSSRAVYDGYPVGTCLTEELAPLPKTIYGQVKAEAEAALGCGGVSIRATGVFGPPVPGRPHKWAGLFDRFRHGEEIEPGIGTEVHAQDVARAVEIAMIQLLRGTQVNASGFLLDRRDLLMAYESVTGVSGLLPDASDPASVKIMRTDALRRFGWQPSGPETIPQVIRCLTASPQ